MMSWVRPRIHSEADAEDVVQDVLERLARRDPGDMDDVRAFLWKSTRNAVVDHYRRDATRAKTTNAVAHEPGSEDPGEEETPDRLFLAACLHPFVKNLPAPYREAIELTDLGELTQAQAAERVGISVSGMKSRVQRGRAMLRDDVVNCCAVSKDARGRVVEVTPRSCEGDCSPR